MKDRHLRAQQYECTTHLAQHLKPSKAKQIWSWGNDYWHPFCFEALMTEFERSPRKTHQFLLPVRSMELRSSSLHNVDCIQSCFVTIAPMSNDNSLPFNMTLLWFRRYRLSVVGQQFCFVRLTMTFSHLLYFFIIVIWYKLQATWQLITYCSLIYEWNRAYWMLKCPKITLSLFSNEENSVAWSPSWMY